MNTNEIEDARESEDSRTVDIPAQMHEDAITAMRILRSLDESEVVTPQDEEHFRRVIGYRGHRGKTE